jgi:hypothetical protein
MKELESIWQKPIYLPYLQPQLTEEILLHTEKKLGVKLPILLIKLLKIQNGGYIRKTIEGSVHEQIYGIGPHYPSLTDVNWSDYKDWVSFELEGLIPFDGDGHWYICLDYRINRTEPEITYIDTECDQQEKIAHSFEEYLSLLTLSLDEDAVVHTDKSIDDFIIQLEDLLNIKFEEPDKYAHGYNQYRCELQDSWLWLSPNHVPYGFVREEEDRYEELVQLTKSKTLRFPELPETSLLISFSDDKVRNIVVEKLKENNIKINLLEEILTVE